MNPKFFVDRRSGQDRRSGEEQRQNPRLDLPHKRRRRQADRRRGGTMAEDFYALQGMEAEDFKAGSRRH